MFFAVAVAPAPASARGDRDPVACNRGDGEDRIAACSRILDRGGRESGETRAVAHVNRAYVYNSKGDYDRAIRDLDDAKEIQGAGLTA